MRSPSGACGSESPNSHTWRVNAVHPRWCPGFSRQAWLTECRFELDTDATDRHGYIAFEPPCGACGSEPPNPHASPVNAAHQRWCPGFSRQVWLTECRFELDTDAADRHGYIAVEPLCGAPAEHAGRIAEFTNLARKRCTPTLVSRLQPPIMVDGVSIQVGHGCYGQARIHCL